MKLSPISSAHRMAVRECPACLGPLVHPTHHEPGFENQTLLRKEETHKDRIQKMLLRSQPSTIVFAYSSGKQFLACGELPTLSTYHQSSTLPESFLPEAPELAR